MEIEGCAAVNKDQGAEEKRQPMITNAAKHRREKRPRVENEKLHEQPRQPEDRDHRADRAGEGNGRSELISIKKRQRSKRDDDQDDEAAVDPKQPAKKWMKRRKIRAPVQYPRSKRARDQDYKVQEAADDQDRFHSAPIVCMKGTITRLTNGGWKSQNAGAATTSIVKSHPRKIAVFRCARTASPWRRK